MQSKFVKLGLFEYGLLSSAVTLLILLGLGYVGERFQIYF